MLRQSQGFNQVWTFFKKEQYIFMIHLSYVNTWIEAEIVFDWELCVSLAFFHHHKLQKYPFF